MIYIDLGYLGYSYIFIYTYQSPMQMLIPIFDSELDNKLTRGPEYLNSVESKVSPVLISATTLQPQ